MSESSSSPGKDDPISVVRLTVFNCAIDGYTLEHGQRKEQVSSVDDIRRREWMQPHQKQGSQGLA